MPLMHSPCDISDYDDICRCAVFVYVVVSCKMLQVLQKTVDQQLCLYSDVKEQSVVVAQVMVMSLMSQPVADEGRMTFCLFVISVGFSFLSGG